MPRRARNLLRSAWFKLALSAVLLALLFFKTDTGELRAALVHTRPGWLLLAFLGYELSQVMSAVRWYLLAQPLGFREPFTRVLAYYYSGMYLNLFAPSTVAGDIGRALYLAGGRGRRALALTSVIADRGIGFVALVWVGAAAILLVPGYPLPRIIYLAAWLVPPATLASWWLAPLFVIRFFSEGGRIRALVEHDLAPYRRDHRLLGVSFLLACTFHVVQITTQLFIAWAMGLAIPWTFILIFVPIVNIAGMLPISMSGIGVREGGYLYFLSLIGVDHEAAIALGLLSSAIVLITGLSGTPAFLLLNRKLHVRSEVTAEVASEAPLVNRR